LGGQGVLSSRLLTGELVRDIRQQSPRHGGVPPATLGEPIAVPLVQGPVGPVGTTQTQLSSKGRHRPQHHILAARIRHGDLCTHSTCAVVLDESYAAFNARSRGTESS